MIIEVGIDIDEVVERCNARELGKAIELNMSPQDISEILIILNKTSPVEGGILEYLVDEYNRGVFGDFDFKGFFKRIGIKEA